MWKAGKRAYERYLWLRIRSEQYGSVGVGYLPAEKTRELVRCRRRRRQQLPTWPQRLVVFIVTSSPSDENWMNEIIYDSAWQPI